MRKRDFPNSNANNATASSSDKPPTVGIAGNTTGRERGIDLKYKLGERKGQGEGKRQIRLGTDEKWANSRNQAGFYNKKEESNNEEKKTMASSIKRSNSPFVPTFSLFNSIFSRSSS